jgi:hypothetical protein
MKHTTKATITMVLVATSCLNLPVLVAARPSARALSRGASRWLSQDRTMHRTTSALPLRKPATVRRYTSLGQAQAEARRGLAPNTHMTAPVRPGRPPSAAEAQRRFGLPRRPTAVETLRIPKGTPVRKGRVAAEQRRRWEWTSPRTIPPGAVQSVRPTPRPWTK